MSVSIISSAAKGTLGFSRRSMEKPVSYIVGAPAALETISAPTVGMTATDTLRLFSLSQRVIVAAPAVSPLIVATPWSQLTVAIFLSDDRALTSPDASETLMLAVLPTLTFKDDGTFGAGASSGRTSISSTTNTVAR